MRYVRRGIKSAFKYHSPAGDIFRGIARVDQLVEGIS
jgi:hypothetical protein